MLTVCPECGQVDESGGAYCLSPSCGALLPQPTSARRDPANTETVVRASSSAGRSAKPDDSPGTAPDESSRATGKPAKAVRKSEKAVSESGKPVGKLRLEQESSGPDRPTTDGPGRVTGNEADSGSGEPATSPDRLADGSGEPAGRHVPENRPPRRPAAPVHGVVSAAGNWITRRRTGSRPPTPASATRESSSPSSRPRNGRNGRNGLVLPVAVLSALVLLVSAAWLAGRPDSPAAPEQVPPLAAPPVPVTTTAPGAAVPVPPTAAAGTTGPPQSAQPTGPGTTPPRAPAPARPGPATTTRAAPPAPAPTTTKPKTTTTPRISVTVPSRCFLFGADLHGTVVNGGGRTLQRVRVYHGQFGDLPSTTFWLTKGASWDGFTNSTFDTTVPREFDRFGVSVYWEVTVYFNDGATASASGTSELELCD